ncbi:hypothetical protein, partial [Pseudomonas synxantha]|uniref:hypothetical protein n=1 Tax=Pseudomonas synxantha TaxID=47883 RepID=UPI00286CE006
MGQTTSYSLPIAQGYLIYGDVFERPEECESRCGSAFRTVHLEPTLERLGQQFRFSADKNKTPTAFAIGVSEFNLDDDLLSHGETPHYH